MRDHLPIETLSGLKADDLSRLLKQISSDDLTPEVARKLYLKWGSFGGNQNTTTYSSEFPLTELLLEKQPGLAPLLIEKNSSKRCALNDLVFLRFLEHIEHKTLTEGQVKALFARREELSQVDPSEFDSNFDEEICW